MQTPISPGEIPRVTIYSDGSSDGKNAGWACSIRGLSRDTVYLSGSYPHATAQAMELMAAVQALSYLPYPCEVDLWSDSRYVIDGFDYLPIWKARRWCTKGGSAVAHVELWQAIDRLLAQHTVHPHWVKGHAGHVGNEQVDSLAQLRRVQSR